MTSVNWVYLFRIYNICSENKEQHNWHLKIVLEKIKLQAYLLFKIRDPIWKMKLKFYEM